MNFNVCYSLTVPSLPVKSDACSQEINCKRSFKDGSPLPIHPSITIMRVKLSIVELQVGFFKAAHFENGKRTVLYCGLSEIVSLSRLSCLSVRKFLSQFRSRCRKKHSLVRHFLSVPI